MSEVIKIRLQAKPGAERPSYASNGDAGMDVRANEDVYIPAGETRIVKTGLFIAVDPGVEIQVRPRSGISLNTPLRVANAPGTIDSGYRDEIGILISNTSRDYEWNEDGTIRRIDRECSLSDKGNLQGGYWIRRGDRVAQLVFNRVLHAEVEWTDDIKSIPGDRKGGFGHTGTN